MVYIPNHIQYFTTQMARTPHTITHSTSELFHPFNNKRKKKCYDKNILPVHRDTKPKKYPTIFLLLTSLRDLVVKDKQP